MIAGVEITPTEIRQVFSTLIQGFKATAHMPKEHRNYAVGIVEALRAHPWLIDQIPWDIHDLAQAEARKIPPPPDPVEALLRERDLKVLDADPRTKGGAPRPPWLVAAVLNEANAKAPYTVHAASYAKGMCLVRVKGDGSGYKVFANVLVDRVGGRWTGRCGGYVMSPAKVRKLDELYAASRRTA